MNTIQLRHLIDLVAGDVNDGESRIEKIFEWKFERDMTVVRWSLGLAASLAVTVLIAFFRTNSGSSISPVATLTGFELGGALLLALVSATYGIYRLAHLRRLHEQYIAALNLYGRLYSIRDFIHLYRRLS